MTKKHKNMIFISLIFLLQTISIVSWFFLFKWYSLLKHFNTPFFALDKISGHFNSPIIRYTLLIFIVITVCYSINIFLLNKIKNRSTKNIFIVLILFQIIIPLFVYPIGAVDIFTYIAESKLFYFYQQNPYITTYSPYWHDIIQYFAVFLDKPLVYGPVWLFSTAIPNLFIDFSKNNFILTALLSYKIFNLSLLLLTGYFITKFFKDNTSKLKACYLFIANPLVLFEVLSNGHNDILIALFFVLFFYFYKKRSCFAFLFITLASLVKIYCLILIPFIFFKVLKEKWKNSEILKSLVFSMVLIIGFYLPFFLKGLNLNQLIKGIFESQQMQTYSMFSLLKEYLTLNLVRANCINAMWFCILFFFVTISIFIINKSNNKNITSVIFFIFSFFIILLSLSHPWYFIPILAILICSSLKKNNIISVSIITLFLLIFYPLSVWAWFNSGYTIISIHLFQSLFIIPPISFILIWNYFFNNDQ